MSTLVMMAFAVSSVSFTIAVTGIFKFLREWISKIHPKLEDLIHCPYCLSHYVALVFMVMNESFYPRDMWLLAFYSYFGIIGMSAVIHYVLLRAYKPVAEATLHRMLEKQRNKDK